METSPVISARGLSKSYGARLGVRGVSLEVARGSVFGFIGPNGAGKTTTIRLLLGFLRASEGEARVLGRDCWRESHLIKRDVGYLPGDLRLSPWMNGESACQIFGAARRLDLRAACAELAEYFDLDLAVPARSMSRGMRQKLGLILALAHRPSVLVLDEPTSALDPLTQDLLYRRLLEMAGDGCTVFFSSHVLSEVQDLCERVAIIRGGSIVADETVAALRGRAKRNVVIEWAGQPPALSEAPADLQVREPRDAVWKCELAGEVPPLLSWLRDREVVDLAIEPPDLDSLFKRYYLDGEGR